MKDIQLTEHFKLSEFLRSNTAERLGIDNRPAPEDMEQVVNNLRRLCTHVLEPLREYVKKPVTINSGYRCPVLNKAVGGARRSYHLTGRAADLPFHPSWLAYIRDHLPYKELINEGRCIHVAL